MDKEKGFDFIAPYYDLLVRLAFGKEMIQAQMTFLSKIGSSSKVLVLGGGTGLWLNKFLLGRHDCKITYVESSQKMIAMARRGVVDDKQIEFRYGTEDLIIEIKEFDAIMTFCYLDLFPEGKLDEVVEKITESLKPDATWLVVDFVSVKRWHKWMLLLMYRFFGIVAGLRNQTLADWENSLRKAGFQEFDSRFFYGNFIKTALLKRKAES